MSTGWLRAAVIGLAAIGAAVVVALLARASMDDGLPHDAERVGTAVCLSCHEAQAAYAGTAHHETSRRATPESIDGSFAEGENLLRTSSPSLHYRMDSTASGFFQTAVIGATGGAEARTRTERIDLVVGSGRKGQSYLSWTPDSALVQLPVSYWRGAGWVNSPGYREGVVNFERPVLPRCLECHATSFAPLPDFLRDHRYDPGSAVLGIGCETCHGPGSAHVARQRSWTRVLPGTAVLDPATLPRIRRVEACALCHGGAGRSLARPFSYVPGRPLDAHVELPPTTGDDGVDVHGNQVALLTASPCFQGSDMTCGTCHDVHAPQRDAAAFVPRCLACHQVESCGLFPARGAAIADGCVDCHMPALPSTTVLSTVGGDTLRPRIRTHRIGIHPSDGR